MRTHQHDLVEQAVAREAGGDVYAARQKAKRASLVEVEHELVEINRVITKALGDIREILARPEASP